MQRREFLKTAGAGLLTFSASAREYPRVVRLGTAGERRPMLVVLYLRGGVDALSVVVPRGDGDYAELRPTLAIDPAEVGGIELDKRFSLHPALAGLAPLWRAGRLAPIVNVGSHHLTRSHFDAQDFMEYGAPGMRNVHEGWLNRYLSSTAAGASAGSAAEGGLRALGMQGLLPRSLRGGYPVLAVPERKVIEDQAMLDLFSRLYGGDEALEGDTPAGMDPGDPAQRDEPVRAAGLSTLAALEHFQSVIADDEASEPGSQTRFPRSILGRRLRTLASAIRGEPELEVAALDLLGYDTHIQQGSVAGTLPILLADLGDSVAAFFEDLGPLIDQTLVAVVSEFGRTCRENGNYGTDHGHGGVFLLAGAGVQGGEVHGTWKGLKERSLHEGRDLPVHTDFRDVFAEILRSHLGFDVTRGFFPDHRPSRVRGLF